MIERGTGRPAGHLAALGLILLAGLGFGAGALAGAPALASAERSGEDSGAPDETQSSPTGTSNCPSLNPPNQLTLVAGTPQTTTLDTAFAGGLQVALANSDGCAVTGAAGVPVTFSAPAGGASGRFSTSNSNTATVGADASGTVAAPTFTANGTAGSYTVTASSQYGSVSFSLTNTAAGIPARLAAIPLKRRSTRVGGRFPQPLQVRVLDAGGNPVAGATVTFTLGAGSAGALRHRHRREREASPAAAPRRQPPPMRGGLATSPALIATRRRRLVHRHRLDLRAAAARARAEGTGKAAASRRRAGRLLARQPRRRARQDRPRRRLHSVHPGGERVPDPPRGHRHRRRQEPGAGRARHLLRPGRRGQRRASRSAPGGSHHHRAHVSHSRTVKVKTGACGIAVAPPFTASAQPGGYVVEASAEPARPAAFALVNEAPGQSL